MVTQAGAGIACAPEDAESIASAIVSIYNLSAEERELMGQRGREWYMRTISMKVGIDNMEESFRLALVPKSQ